MIDFIKKVTEVAENIIKKTLGKSKNDLQNALVIFDNNPLLLDMPYDGNSGNKGRVRNHGTAKRNINLAGLDPVRVLVSLWEHASPTDPNAANSLSYNDAKEILQQAKEKDGIMQISIEKHEGRRIYVVFQGTVENPYCLSSVQGDLGYGIYNGKDDTLFEKVIKSVIAEQQSINQKSYQI